jgi:WW domain-containing oxidoreductase
MVNLYSLLAVQQVDKFNDIRCTIVNAFIIEGIGTETARALATVNAHVIITARDMNKGAEVVEDLKNSTGNNKIEVMELDLNSLQSVRNFVDQFRARNLPINILICK